jgi:hypothetical protein
LVASASPGLRARCQPGPSPEQKSSWIFPWFLKPNLLIAGIQTEGLGPRYIEESAALQ